MLTAYSEHEEPHANESICSSCPEDNGEHFSFLGLKAEYSRTAVDSRFQIQ